MPLAFRLMLVVLLASCGGAPHEASVTIAPLPAASSPPPVHAPPAPTAQAFLDAGCKNESNPGMLDCKSSSSDLLSACMSVHVLPVTFDPPAVVAECFVRETGNQHGVRSSGCMLPMSAQLVAATRGGLVSIRSPAELAKAFAPVGSEAEAIAFAVALTGNEEVKARDPDSKNLGISESKLEADGYHVRLFSSQMCGCSHPTWAIDDLVTRDGKVTELTRKVVWEDPKSRGLCVD